MRNGDLNGDGLADLIVASAMADVGNPMRTDAGVVEIRFGRADFSGPLDAAGTAGTAPDLSVLGATAGDQLSKGGALLLADLNGDGRQDLVRGAPGGDGPGEVRTIAGEACIVFGKDSHPTQLDLGTGSADLTIHVASASDLLTSSGAMAAGDVNGDGLADLELGAPGADDRGLRPILGAFSETADGGLQTEIALHARAGLPPLTLHLSFDAGTDTLSGELIAPGGESAELQAWHRPIDTGTAAELAGRHAFALRQDDSEQVQEAGLYQVSPKLGAWGASRLADGSNFTTAPFVGPQGQLLLYQPLYANHGSLAGVLHLESIPPKGATMTGNATWHLASRPGRGKSVDPGFGPLPLQAEGVEP